MPRSTTAAAGLGFAAAALLVLGACSGGDSPVAAEQLSVTSSDDVCTVNDDRVAAGPVTLTVVNEGDQVTEVYVYGEGDTIIGEKEDITPGSSADFTVELEPGRYEIACKPGQTGDGIRTELTVE
jgi:iron uptake system component EfeO